MSDIISDLTAIANDIEVLPPKPSTVLIDQMIEKSRDQKVSVQELHLDFINQYGYGYIMGRGREPEFRDKRKISQRKWDSVRKLVTALLIKLERRVELLIALREHSEQGAFDKKTG